jgi:DNA-binding GntR family transcriptional regulator
MAGNDQFITAQQQAYGYIRDLILDGTLAAGAWLNTSAIADELALSRIPVREAVRQLDAEGLVMIRPNRGAVVTDLQPADVEELFEMRAALESLAIRKALPHLVGETLDDLEALRQRMDRVRGDSKAWIPRHREFHDFLCRASGMPRLAGEIRRIELAVQPYLMMYISVYGQTEMPGYEHGALVDAIRTGNSTLAEICMRDHVLSAGRGVVEHLRSRAAGPAAPAKRPARRLAAVG